MDHFQYHHNELYVEDVKVAELAARFGTPCYIYSYATLERHWTIFQEKLKNHSHRICYAVKANSNLTLLNKLAKLGAGFDIVSLGELKRVLKAGGNPHKIIFSGVAKSVIEIQTALAENIFCFNVESWPELLRINSIAKQLNKIAQVSLRINPNVDAKTHPHISTGLEENKFGIPWQEAMTSYQQAQSLSHIKTIGLACHIGSQLVEITPFITALKQLLSLYDELQKNYIHLTHLDLGGGLGVRYHEETPPSPAHYIEEILTLIASRNLEVIFEPGRVIVANAGILITKVEYIKKTSLKQFALVDAGMNDLLRPALYEAWHTIIPVTLKSDLMEVSYDVVGPVCETADFLGKNRNLRISEGDLLAIRGAGAYGFVMSSNYNSRPRPAELLIEGDVVQLIRARESLEDLWRGEEI